MTFERLSALTKLVREYECHKMPAENVVILISFDQLSELRAMITKSLLLTQENKEYFMGCEVVMVLEHDYVAVAYVRDGEFYKKQEVSAELIQAISKEGET